MPADCSSTPRLIATDHGLAVVFEGGNPVRPRFDLIDTRSSMGARLTQPLFKAVGIRKHDPYRPSVLDGTAGLGEDAWLFASIGCKVIAVERHEVVYRMLLDAVTRAGGAFEVRHGDLLRDELPHMDVVYLDPMFDAPRKTLARKPMRALHALVGPDEDQAELLPRSLQLARRRVVVKRPAKAPWLAGVEPVHSHKGQAVRFDVYVPGVTKLV